MFEATALPRDFVAPLSAVDELWVPSRFVADLYIASGVAKEAVVVVPESVDTDTYNPEVVAPLGVNPPWNTYGIDVVTSPAPFRFFSMFNEESAHRKGVSETVIAFINSFPSTDNVVLYLPRVFAGQADNIQRLMEGVDSSISFKEVMLRMGHIKPYDFIPQADLPSFYKTMDCLVLPTVGEGWGRPISEAMAMALPVIVTGWSGETEFARQDNSFLLEYDLVEDARLSKPEHRIRTARARIPSLQAAMREVFLNQQAARERGRKARELIVARYSGPAVAEIVRRQLKRITLELLTNKRMNEVRMEPYPGSDWAGLRWEEDFSDAEMSPRAPALRARGPWRPTSIPEWQQQYNMLPPPPPPPPPPGPAPRPQGQGPANDPWGGGWGNAASPNTWPGNQQTQWHRGNAGLTVDQWQEAQRAFAQQAGAGPRKAQAGVVWVPPKATRNRREGSAKKRGM